LFIYYPVWYPGTSGVLGKKSLVIDGYFMFEEKFRKIGPGHLKMVFLYFCHLVLFAVCHWAREKVFKEKNHETYFLMFRKDLNFEEMG